MFRNYLTVAVRNLIRQRLYAAINTLGLAVGIAFCILALLFVRFEWSFDRFHENADRTFLVRYDYEQRDGVKPGGTTSPVLAPSMKEDLPEVERIVRVYPFDIFTNQATLRVGDRYFVQSAVYAEDGFFRVFSFPLVSGRAESALEDARSVVLNSHVAKLIWGDEDPVGERIAVMDEEGFQDYVVAGVIDVPANSSIQFGLAISASGSLSREPYTGRWGDTYVYTFLQVAGQREESSLRSKLPAFVEHRMPEEVREGLLLTGLSDIHLSNSFRYGLGPLSKPGYSYTLLGIAFAVLAIACANYTNLSIGLSSTRFREVGVRKVMGAARRDLVRQFWGESVLVTLVGLLAGVALAEACLPLFNQLIGQTLELDVGQHWWLLLILVISVGILAGSYPSLVLSRLDPVGILKGRPRVGGGRSMSRILVVVQFCVSIVLIASTIVMYRQMHLLRSADMGFDKEQVVVVDTGLEPELPSDVRDRLLGVYKKAAQERGQIIGAGIANMYFGGTLWGVNPKHGEERILFRTFGVDDDFFGVLGVELAEGRFFSTDRPGDPSGSVMVNEAMVRRLGLDSPVGGHLPFSRQMGQSSQNLRDDVIVGVVRDFNFQSLHHEVDPAVFHLRPTNGTLRFILVKIGPDDVKGTLALLKEIWEDAVTDRPFTYTFLDEDVNSVYRDDQRWSDIALYSAVLAIGLAALGAFGLTALSVARRAKEVGVRKVLGASAGSIVALFSRDFARLVGVATLIACPLAYFVLRDWLQGFAYRVSLGPGAFLMAGLLCLGIVLLAVGVQAAQASLADPAETLRYE